MLESLGVSIYAVGVAFLVKAVAVLVLVGQAAIRQSAVKRVGHKEMAVNPNNERSTDELTHGTLTKERRKAPC